jgi:hypothetical protein
MPRSDYCPTCETRVKIPQAAKRGMFIRCPACEETFQPKFLKPIDVLDEDEVEAGYEFADDEKPSRAAKNSKYAEVSRNIRNEQSETHTEKDRRGWFEGVEGMFLILALAGAAIVPIFGFGAKYLSEHNPAMVALIGLALPTFFILLLVVVRLRRSGGIDYRKR